MDARVAGALRLAEVLGALSLTTDLGAGVPFEKGLRTCAVAAGLAEALDLPLADRRDAYYAALLRSLGCTAQASVFAEMFDDDVAVQRELKTLDFADPTGMAAQAARFSTWAGSARRSSTSPAVPAASSTRTSAPRSRPTRMRCWLRSTRRIFWPRH